MLDQECLLLQEFKEVSAAADGTIQVLLEMIEDVRRLTATALQVTTESRRQLEPFGALAARLTGSLEQLSYEMRLIALNVEIQAVQIGGVWVLKCWRRIPQGCRSPRPFC